MKKTSARKSASAKSRFASAPPANKIATSFRRILKNNKFFSGAADKFLALNKGVTRLNGKLDEAIKSAKAQDVSALAVRGIEPAVLSTLNLVKDLMTVTVSIIPAARVQRVASPSRRSV